MSVRLWIGPGFVGLSHKPTPTVIGSLLKPLVTSARSKYSKSFWFYTEGVDRPGFIRVLAPQSISLLHTYHTLLHITDIIIAFVNDVISRRGGTDPPQTPTRDENSVREENCRPVYPETKFQVTNFLVSAPPRRPHRWLIIHAKMKYD